MFRCATQSGAERRFRGFLGWAVTASCAVVAAAVGASAAGPALAQQVALANATYSYGAGGSTGYGGPVFYLSSSSPLGLVSNPLPPGIGSSRKAPERSQAAILLSLARIVTRLTVRFQSKGRRPLTNYFSLTSG